MVTAPQENRKPGESPGRYRRCMREGFVHGESRSLGFPREGRTELMIRKSEELLKCGKTHGSASTGSVIFCCGKTAAVAHLSGLLQLFCCDCLRGSPPWSADCSGGHSPQPTEYCLSMRYGDPVKIRNNRPLLCLASAISQKACRIDWVYHALIGECNLVCPYLRTDRLHSFSLHEDHIGK